MEFRSYQPMAPISSVNEQENASKKGSLVLQLGKCTLHPAYSAFGVTC